MHLIIHHVDEATTYDHVTLVAKVFQRERKYEKLNLGYTRLHKQRVSWLQTGHECKHCRQYLFLAKKMSGDRQLI